MPFRRATLILLALLLGAWPAGAQPGDPSFTLVNRSGRVIYELYVSPSSDSRWGSDRLGRGVLQDGQSFALRLPAGECVQDIRVVYDRAGGPAEERRGVNTCRDREVVFSAQPGPSRPTQPAPATSNPSFNLVNNSGRVVREVYASPATDQNWGPNRLGAETVPNGQFHPIRLPLGECLYDLRVVFDSGPPQERRRINLCEVVNLTVPFP
ncbi:MAG TPA: hypothetical protein VD970_06470 [Acetobacteraceae bacterium]|nr:hypothetical protein [Acetobacteraceae bacterium]